MVKYHAQYSSALLRFARTPSKLSAQDFHKGMDTRGENDTTTPSLYADWLRGQGKPTVAGIIQEHVNNLGYGHGVADLSPAPDADPSDHQSWEPGEFRAKILPFGKGHALQLHQQSLSTPGKTYSWHNSLDADEVPELTKALQRDGVDVRADEEHHEQYGLKERDGDLE